MTTKGTKKKGKAEGTGPDVPGDAGVEGHASGEVDSKGSMWRSGEVDTGLEYKGIEYSEDQQYPFLVIRWMSAVYGKKKIVFVSQGESKLKGDSLVVVADGPCDTCGQLPAETLPRLVGAILPIVVSEQRRMCLVLSPTNGVYIEPDGKVRWTDELPSGGMLIPDPEIIRDFDPNTGEEPE